jgi:hypothetical protein
MTYNKHVKSPGTISNSGRLSSIEPDVHDLSDAMADFGLEICRDLASEIRRELADAKMALVVAERARKREMDQIVWALGAIYKLHGLLSSDSEGIQHPGPVPRWPGMPSIGMPGYGIAQLVLLIFPGDTFKPAGLISYVNLLRLAEQQHVKPGDFRKFVREHGGLTTCIKLAVKHMRKLESVSRK